jgi:exonuclease VII small subunit
MSAEAVTMQYEATAESVEQLGNMIRDFAPRLEAELKEFDRNLKLIEKAANHVREKGKHIQSLIKEASQLSKTMRHTCEDVVKKVVGDSDTL